MTELMFPRLTPRLLLRPLMLDDRDAIHHLYRDWAVARWLSRLPWPFTPESAETLIAEAAADLERGRGLFLAVAHRTTGAFVGTLSLRLPAYDADPWTDDKRLGVLGYAIAPKQQGNGFASEAAASMVELACTDMHLLRSAPRYCETTLHLAARSSVCSSGYGVRVSARNRATADQRDSETRSCSIAPIGSRRTAPTSPERTRRRLQRSMPV